MIYPVSNAVDTDKVKVSYDETVELVRNDWLMVNHHPEIIERKKLNESVRMNTSLPLMNLKRQLYDRESSAGVDDTFKCFTQFSASPIPISRSTIFHHQRIWTIDTIIWIAYWISDFSKVDLVGFTLTLTSFWSTTE